MNKQPERPGTKDSAQRNSNAKGKCRGIIQRHTDSKAFKKRHIEEGYIEKFKQIRAIRHLNMSRSNGDRRSNSDEQALTEVQDRTVVMVSEA